MQYTREQLAIIRKKCDDDLMFFTRFFFKQLRGIKFIVNDHHNVIAHELQRIQNYELDLLNINIPPRFSKTELAAVNFIARGIGMNPTSNWLYITASDELRSQTSVSIRDIVSHPLFYLMYGVELKKDQNGKNLWRTTQGGGLKTATIGGQITGFGAGQMVEHDEELEDYCRTFEGCIVLDDINKIDDSQQENANNEKVSRIIFNTVMSRKNSKDTPIINIQQRAGVSDATAKFQEYYKDNPKAMFLVMPVISKDGVPLWAWKHDVEEIEQLKNNKLTSANFSTQYMQDPIDIRGILIPFDELKWGVKFDESKLEENEQSPIIARYAYSDPADGGGDHLSTIYLDFIYSNNNLLLHVADVVHTTSGIETTSPIIVEKLDENKIERIRIEANGVGTALVIQLRQMLNKGEHYTTLEPYKEILNKDQKINTYYEFVKDRFTFDRDKYDTSDQYRLFIDHLTTYVKEGNNKHKKDAIDICCSAARHIKNRFRDYLII